MDQPELTPKKEPMRRKKRSLERIIKEDYLPYAISGFALVLVIIFIGGAIGRAAEQRRAEEVAASIAAAEAEAEAEEEEAEEKEEYPEGNPFESEKDIRSTRRIDLSELKFGRNYSGKGK